MTLDSDTEAPAPLTADAALDRFDAWLSARPAVAVQPTPEHGSVLRRLLGGAGVGANLVNDAHLAALAIEHRGAVVSYDNHFSRFSGVNWMSPTDQASHRP